MVDIEKIKAALEILESVSQVQGLDINQSATPKAATYHIGTVNASVINVSSTMNVGGDLTITNTGQNHPKKINTAIRLIREAIANES